MPMTMMSGAHAVKGFNGEMMSMESRMAMIRKYMLARRVNCNRRALGKKLRREYLEVRTKLVSN